MSQKPIATYPITDDRCPNCAHPLDHASDLFGFVDGPAPGDLSVCCRCGALLQFNPSMKLQLADEALLSQHGKSALARIRDAIHAVNKLN